MDKERDGKQEDSVQGSTVQIAVIYMASGFGKRFGKNKLLEELDGKKLFLYGLELFAKWAKETQNKESAIKLKVILVSQYREILEAGRALGVHCVENRQAEEGITASIRLGIEAAGDADFYLFSVADQPWLKQSTVKDFVHSFLKASKQKASKQKASKHEASKQEASKHCSIGCLSAKKDGGGNPVIFARRYRGELLALKGDKGGSQVMKNYPGEVFYVWAEEKEIKDIDRPSDL